MSDESAKSNLETDEERMKARHSKSGRLPRRLGFEALESRQLLTVNLAMFQTATADSQSGVNSAEAAVDGIVSNDSRWQSIGFGPHWLDVELSAPYAVGSAHLYLGVDTGQTPASFSIHHFTGGGWVTAGSVANNLATEVKVPFASTVSGATRFRFYTTVGTVRVREFVLLPPGDFPLGTGVDLNLAARRGPDVSSVYAGTNVGINAVDGWVSDNSRWLANDTAGPHSIDVHLVTAHLVGSLHLYSGFVSGGSTSTPLANFTIEYANGTSGWLPISGGTTTSGTLSGNQVTGNASDSLAINFATPVTATSIRIGFTAAFGRIRELVVLPATATSDGSVGYPVGTSVRIASKPTTTFDQYGDAYFRINSRVNSNALVSTASSSSLLSGATITEENQFQLLYDYALDAYRIRNRDTGKAIQVAGASTASGAAIVEGEFSGSPHQLWRLIPTDTGYFQIVNVWSRMVLDVDVSGTTPVVTQKARDTNTNPVNRQEWITSLVTINTKKGTGGFVGQYGASWAYNWGTTTTAANDPAVLHKDFLFAPMQWGGGQTNVNNLLYRYADWHNNVKPQFLMGFNEPDAVNQSNLTVERALELWPQLVAMDLPLLSPVNSDGHEAWLESFADQADAKGYRIDYTGMHWYSSPNVTAAINSIDTVQTQGNGRPVWLTEFSVVDWSGGSGNWSEESNYNFILEFLWRLEAKTNLDKYAVFLWTGDSPTNPWDLANPRSNFKFNDGTLTPFGKAYAAWDNDTTIRNDTPYVLHNRSAAHRIANSGSDNLSAATIRTEDASVQWQLRDAGNGKQHIVSGADGRLLRYNGTTLDFAPKGATGTAVEWTVSQEQYGWRNIIHPQSGKYLQLNRTNNSSNAPTALNFTMVTAAAATTTASNWWFAKPFAPVSDVGPVTDISPALNQVTENSPIGTTVGITASATDPDPGQTVTYSLTNNAGNRFAIEPTTGVVTVAGPLDYETATSHSITILATSSDGTTSSAVFVVNVLDVNEFSSVTNRRVFYYNATGANLGSAGAADNAIAIDKAALLPGGASTFTNYTNYSRGLNGVIVDINNLPATTTDSQMLASLQFAHWNGIDVAGFSALPTAAIPSVTILAGSGVGGAARVKITFPDNTLQNTWLRVTVLANAQTALAANDVFYYGNVIGEFNTGNTGTRMRVNATDTGAVRSNQSTASNSALVTNMYDVNRDGRVNATDTGVVRSNQQTAGIVAPITVPLPPSAPLGTLAGDRFIATPSIVIASEIETRGSGTGQGSLLGANSEQPLAVESTTVNAKLISPTSRLKGDGSHLADTRIEPAKSDITPSGLQNIDLYFASL